MKAVPTRFWIAFSSSCICRRSFRSSAPSGSSSSSTAGSTTSARASATRCRWPPESWCGFLSKASARPTSASASRARRDASGRGVDAAHAQAEADIAADAHMREQRIVLEDRRGRPPRRRHRGAVLAADEHLAFARRDEAAEDRQQRRLARAGRAEQHRVAARPRSSSDTSFSAVCRPKRCETPSDLDQRRRSCRPPPEAAASSSSIASTIETAKTSEPTALVFGIEAGAQQVPDLDRQGRVEAGQQEGDDELVPGEGHRQEEARRTAPATCTGTVTSSSTFHSGAPRSRAARSMLIW